ncbi:MAG: cytosine deaminase [Leptolyngbyaceae cyanobacterium SL_7_1]|nr:cytosine deaminase [Leptolyngbyaceae cyanobacterium SL_7_1]
MIPNTNAYWLANAHVPVPLLVGYPCAIAADLALVHLEIRDGVIAQILPGDQPPPSSAPIVDLNRGQVWCCFIDLHTHLDKGHIWERSPNPTGTFEDALRIVASDSHAHWRSEDVYRRMEFGLKCSYAHGTSAIRTHIDSSGEQARISLDVFKTLKAQWADRLTLQAVSLVPLDYFMTPAGEQLADQMAAVGGVLGGLPMMGEELDAQLDRVFTLATERHLDLDLHTDESDDPNAVTLRHVAMAVLRHGFTGQVVCGHCCSLAVQSPEESLKTIQAVKQARIGIVSLPLCNLYLQGRNPIDGQRLVESIAPRQTPRWRGVTLLHELKHYGVAVAIASDNCRDPFHAYGDHDGLEVYSQSVRIAQLDAPHGDWCRAITTTPADLMRLPTLGRIGVGLPADLIVFKARYFSELLSRPQSDRIVLRQGKAIDTTLPDYTELDDLITR